MQGMNPVEQTAIDKKMLDLDGTDNKAKLGANAILAVSLAVAKVSQTASNSHIMPQTLLHLTSSIQIGTNTTFVGL